MRCPLSSRDSVLFEIPVFAASAGQGHAAPGRSRLRRGPTSARTSGSPASSPRAPRYWRFPETATNVARPRRGSCTRRAHGTRRPMTWSIVGGGAAGLSAALVLGRARRRVAVIDAGAAAQRARRAHAGLPVPRRDAARRPPGRRPRRGPGYGVELVDDRVVAIEPGFTSRPRRAASRCRRGGSCSPPAPPTSCPTSPAPASGGAATSCTARTATAGRCATSRSACSAPAPARSSTPTCSASGPTTSIFFAHTYAVTARRARGARRARHPRRRRARRAARRSSTIACRPCSSPTAGSFRAAAVFIRPALHAAPDGLLASLGCELDEAGFVSRRRHRPDQRARRLGRRQRRQPARAGDHRRRRRIRRRDRHQRRPRRGRRSHRARATPPPHRRQGVDHDRHHCSTARTSRRRASTSSR